MEYGTMVKVATISLWNYFALIVNIVAFIIIFMKAKKNRTLKAFFVVQLSMVIWLLGKVLKTVSPTESLRWFFIVFYYFGICLLEVSFLDFSYIYCKDRPMKKTLRHLVYGLGLLDFMIVVTNPWHYLFYSEYSFWGDEFGSLFYLRTVMNYLFILIGMVYCTIKFKKRLKDKKPLERHLISLAIVVPLIFNFIYITRTLEAVFDYFHIQVFDITPIVYTWSLLVFVYATFKYDFFDMTPIMKHEVTKKLDNPILVLDHAKHVLYCNSACKAQGFDLEMARVQISLQDDCKNVHTLRFHGKAYTYIVKEAKMWYGKRFVVFFTDITAYELAKQALDTENETLKESNEKLEERIEALKQMSYMGARHYMARELHDVLGHALVVTAKLLEVSKVFYKSHRTRACESLQRASESVKKGFEDMKNITRRDHGEIYHTSGLEKEIAYMLRAVNMGGIEVRFFMRGESKVLDEKVYDTIKKLITELTTNTLKHSKATNLLLIVTTEHDQLTIQTMDNGVGVKNLKKGNGLMGIDSRLSHVKGKAVYKSENDEGFMANIVVPL